MAQRLIRIPTHALTKEQRAEFTAAGVLQPLTRFLHEDTTGGWLTIQPEGQTWLVQRVYRHDLDEATGTLADIQEWFQVTCDDHEFRSVEDMRVTRDEVWRIYEDEPHQFLRVDGWVALTAAQKKDAQRLRKLVEDGQEAQRAAQAAQRVVDLEQQLEEARKAL